MIKIKILIIVFAMQSPIAIGATYNLQEVHKHATVEDCWIVIQDKIYNVTSYILKHPAPKDAILKYCGKLADQGWQTKDIGKPHSPMALRTLKKFEIGVLKNESGNPN